MLRLNGTDDTGMTCIGRFNTVDRSDDQIIVSMFSSNANIA